MSDLAQAKVQSDQDIAPLLLPAQVLRNDAEAIEAATGELLDFRPRQLALLVATRGLLARDLCQLMSGLDRLCIVAQYLCRQ